MKTVISFLFQICTNWECFPNKIYTVTVKELLQNMMLRLTKQKLHIQLNKQQMLRLQNENLRNPFSNSSVSNLGMF